MVNPQSYLGIQLKDDRFLELLAKHDLTIRYDIDTTHENIPDAYWIKDSNHGVSFKADENQQIVCCFVYIRSADGYKAYPGPIHGLDIVDGNIPAMGGPSKSGKHGDTSWVRYDSENLSVHLTCDSMGPTLLCLMLPSQVPRP